MDLISDPLATVQGAYQHFGMTLSDTTADAIERYVAARPRGGYAEHLYRFEDHGLNEQAEREKFRPYMIQFGIAAEAVQGKRPAGGSKRGRKPAEAPESAG